MKRKLGLLLCITAMLLLVCFPALAEGAIELTDMAGRTISLDGAALKVIALNPADCEIIHALGAEAVLVGRGEYCNYPETVLELPSVNSGADYNIEQILALQPQVIVMTTMAQTTEQVEALENAGIRVVISDAQSIADTYISIEMIGQLLGKTAEADALIADMKEGFESIAANAVTTDATVYFEVSPLQWGLWTSGANTFMNELGQICGLTNLFGDVEGWAEVSQEQVIDRNPDFIITTSGYYGEGPLPTDEIMARTGWEGINAVKNATVYAIDSDIVSRPGPRLVEAAQILLDLVNSTDAQANAA